MRQVTQIALLIAGWLLAGQAVAQTHIMQASPNSYNRLVFPAPYSKVIIPPNAPLAERPVPLNGHKALLLKPKATADTIPVFVELNNGKSFTVLLKTDKTLKKGTVFRYNGAPDTSRVPPKEKRPADEFIARVMKAAAQNKTPTGFAKTKTGKKINLIIDKSSGVCGCRVNMTLKPVASYQGSQHVINVFQLSADQLVEVDPRDFWRRNVQAISVLGDVVGKHHYPLLIVLEADNNG